MNGGSYIDQKILQLRKLSQSVGEAGDITGDEIYLNGKWIRFKEAAIFDGAVRLWIPENFVRMPEEVARVKYISSYRPPVILTSTSYGENLGFHLLKREDADLDRLIRQMEEALLIHAPETVIYDNGSISSKNSNGRWFEYKNFTLNDETYNMQFLLYVTPYLLVGTFNCEMSSYDEWKPLVLKSLCCMTIGNGE